MAIASTPKITLSELNLILHRSPSSQGGEELSIFYHSQTLQNFLAQNTEQPFVLFARSGKTYDAHILAKEVLNKNGFFVGEEHKIRLLYPLDSRFSRNDDEDFDVQKILCHENFIAVNDPETALNLVLEKALKIKKEDFFSIAVTGTNGKTSVTQIIGHLLEAITQKYVLKIGTLGAQISQKKIPVSHVTTPDYPSFMTILAAAQKEDAYKIVLEYTSHGLKENRLRHWSIDIGIFTNLTQDHMDYHLTMEDYRYSKSLPFRNHLKQNGTAIIHASGTEWLYFLLSAAHPSRKIILTGCSEDMHKELVKEHKGKFSHFLFLNMDCIKITNKGISGQLVLRDETSTILESSSVSTSLLGRFQVENILCSVAACISLGFSLENSSNALKNFSHIPGRLEQISLPIQNDLPTILIDYAHTPDALEKALLTCKECLDSKGKLIVVFGCGGDRDSSKRSLMGDIAVKHAHIVIVTSDNPRTEDPKKILRDILGSHTLSNTLLKEVDRQKSLQNALSLATKNDIILVAGKGHEDYQIIGSTKYPFSDGDVLRSLLSHT